jgi:16S rRNA (guanine527-N7)-methyltransferase
MNFEERLADRARAVGVTLSPESMARLETYVRLLSRWNLKINLTALPLNPLTDETVDRLLIEPLAAARYVSDRPHSWFDLGSGGGSPAIPMKILRMSAGLTMVESKSRKAAFLREVVRQLELPAVRVESTRIEDLSDLEDLSELVTFRAVRADRAIFATAARLLDIGGRIMWFGASAEARIEITGLQMGDFVRLSANPSSTVRVLHRVFRNNIVD